MHSSTIRTHGGGLAESCTTIATDSARHVTLEPIVVLCRFPATAVRCRTPGAPRMHDLPFRAATASLDMACMWGVRDMTRLGSPALNVMPCRSPRAAEAELVI